MMRLHVALVCGLLALLALPVRADEPDPLAAVAALEQTFVRVIEQAEKSVVSIARSRVQPPAPMHPGFPGNRPFRFRGEPERTTGPEDVDFIPNEYGAGIVIDREGLILTNYHLVRGGPIEGRADPPPDQVLYVRLPDRRGFDARILAADPRSDLAVLRIVIPPGQNRCVPLPLGSAGPLRKGQFVIALGNPYLIARDGSASATWGIIGNLSRQAMQERELGDSPERRRRETLQNLGVLMHVDTRLDLGTSGGALLNLKGELIGITTTLAGVAGYEKSGGFAVPIDESTRRIIDALRQGKEVEYGFLGIEPENVPAARFAGELAGLAREIDQHGAAEIRRVVANLPAQRGGLRPDDLVLRVGERPILSRSDLMREIGLLAPGTVARLHVWRPASRERLVLPIEVGKWPVIDDEALIATVPLRDAWRGVTFDYPTARLRLTRNNLQTGERTSGVLVLGIDSGSPAADAELQPEDLITHVKGKPVHSPREFEELVQGESGPLTLRVVPAAANSPAATRNVEIKAGSGS